MPVIDGNGFPARHQNAARKNSGGVLVSRPPTEARRLAGKLAQVALRSTRRSLPASPREKHHGAKNYQPNTAMQNEAVLLIVLTRHRPKNMKQTTFNGFEAIVNLLAIIGGLWVLKQILFPEPQLAPIVNVTVNMQMPEAKTKETTAGDHAKSLLKIGWNKSIEKLVSIPLPWK